MATTMDSEHTDPHKFRPFSVFHPSEYLDRWFTIHATEPLLSELSSYGLCRKTHQIQSFPCRVYMVDFEVDKRIRIWIEEREVTVRQCSDYMSEIPHTNDMQSCWVCKWVDISEHWLVDVCENIDETTMKKPDFYRLHGDRYVQFGDGGEAFLIYPVWIHEQLPISESRRQRLLDSLYKLNEKRKDFHPHPSPVEDIIDPDLLPFRPKSTFDRSKWIARRTKQLEKTDYLLRRFKQDLSHGEYNDLSEHEQLRSNYQWLPSEFVVDREGKVDIVTPIHHLPVLPEYRKTYGDIAHIFHAMLPMFEKLKLIKTNCNEEQRLQVIVKAQSYNMKAGMKYSGRWHTEGKTENIVAVGVYYLHVDEELEGGGLKFRPKYSPQNWYTDIEVDRFVPYVRTGTAVVFSNSMPHRFQQIRNLTSEDGLRRTFLNFFIVDPEQRIPLGSNDVICAPKNEIMNTLSKWNDGRLPILVMEKIVKYLNILSAWENEDEAQAFRTRVRRAMLDEKSGWGWICWGNCGTTEFVPSLSAWSPRERQETGDCLHHTESD